MQRRPSGSMRRQVSPASSDTQTRGASHEARSRPESDRPVTTTRSPSTTTPMAFWKPSPPKIDPSSGTRFQVTPSGDSHTAASPSVIEFVLPTATNPSPRALIALISAGSSWTAMRVHSITTGETLGGDVVVVLVSRGAVVVLGRVVAGVAVVVGSTRTTVVSGAGGSVPARNTHTNPAATARAPASARAGPCNCRGLAMRDHAICSRRASSPGAKTPDP